MKRVAWEVEINGMPCITFAETRSKARWNAVKSYRNAFDTHQRGKWPSVKAKRIERFDNHSESQLPGRKCFGFDYIGP